MRYATIRDGWVENVSEWDGATPWTPPEGTEAVSLEGAPPQVSIGWRLVDGEWIAPEPSALQPEPQSATLTTDQLDAIVREAVLKALGAA